MLLVIAILGIIAVCLLFVQVPSDNLETLKLLMSGLLGWLGHGVMTRDRDDGT